MALHLCALRHPPGPRPRTVLRHAVPPASSFRSALLRRTAAVQAPSRTTPDRSHTSPPPPPGTTQPIKDSPAPPPPGTFPLRCKGGASIYALPFVLGCAFPVLRAQLSATATPSEVRLEEDDANTWGTALRLLDPKTHPQAPELSWANLEPVLRLADKYDSPVLRAMCVAFMTCNQTDLSLDLPLPSPKNPLIAATLLEQCCGQPELEPYTMRITKALEKAIAAPADTSGRRELLGKLKTLLSSPFYMKLVSPSVQARVLATLVSVMESVLSGPTCCCCGNQYQGVVSGSGGQWRCNSCGNYNS